MTSGGLTGRGVGSVTIEDDRALIDGHVSTPLTADEAARLHRLPIVRASRPMRAAPDAITYTLTIDGARWTWNDANAPRECASWADVLLSIRERALGG
jgi:hypothetical protein